MMGLTVHIQEIKISYNIRGLMVQHREIRKHKVLNLNLPVMVAGEELGRRGVISSEPSTECLKGAQTLLYGSKTPAQLLEATKL